MVPHVEAAKEWGWSPTAILLQQVADAPHYAKDPRKPHPLDYVLAVACKQLAEEKCSQCGTAAWHAFSTDPNISFKVEEHTCYACAEIETQEEDEKERKKGTRKVAKVVPITYDDGTTEPLPTRTDFYNTLTT